VWGHEHECIPVVQTNGEQNFEIAQPGSSIATSLSEGEAKPKHVGILRINGLNFHWEAVRLKTVRPFVMDEVELKTSGIKPDGDKEKIEDEMAAFLVEKVDEMIERAREDWDELYEGDEYKPKQFPQPLIRLKVEYSGGYATYPPQRFGSRYVGKVANAKEILQFYRKKTTYDPSKERRKAGGTIINEVPDLPERMDDTKVEDLVAEYLEAQQLDLLPENELGDAVKEFVEKDDKDAIKE
jgi:double-strand break repair protein MRE11